MVPVGLGSGDDGAGAGSGLLSPRQVVVIALSGCAQLIWPSIVSGISSARAGRVVKFSSIAESSRTITIKKLENFPKTSAYKSGSQTAHRKLTSIDLLKGADYRYLPLRGEVDDFKNPQMGSRPSRCVGVLNGSIRSQPRWRD